MLNGKRMRLRNRPHSMSPWSQLSEMRQQQSHQNQQPVLRPRRTRRQQQSLQRQVRRRHRPL